MNDAPNVSNSSKHGLRWIWLALSIMIFGALMAFRSEIHSIWLRALVAGIAFPFLYPAIRGFGRRT
jgi:hypothetical protein